MTEELKQLFDEKLNLNLLSVDTRKYFYDVFERYMKHGRSCEFIATNLDILLYFFDASERILHRVRFHRLGQSGRSGLGAP